MQVLRALARSNLIDAAFDLGTQSSGRTLRSDLAAAISLFTTLPCAETAANLIGLDDAFAAALVGYSGSPCRSIPAAARGRNCDGFDEFVARSVRNLATVAAVHRYLRTRCTAGSARIGFHSSRDQAILHQRLAIIDLKKGWFADGRQFLRDTITPNEAAFRIVSDANCVQGVAGGREVFWDAVGNSRDAQWYLSSEIFYDLSSDAASFRAVLGSIR